ncbi:hypothetical protein PoB_002018700 [Plakobranchus ocellatus]|uniref:Uncharacterized protein n=1 Tax=Plakobranchus ocellatus TaxID=259542 RepID=A0AAV3ZGL6_9GAST|nr:hypothetical protein PoB_002018700 [Plakobranchus ocellatus]
MNKVGALVSSSKESVSRNGGNALSVSALLIPPCYATVTRHGLPPPAPTPVPIHTPVGGAASAARRCGMRVNTGACTSLLNAFSRDTDIWYRRTNS